ncbi:MAG: hypothetical protein LBQ65_07295 [Tannerellaceae bacterium]|jgi:hypothetical protein|nr:hypothetical protein [Tannerellaceae bacterium]
METAEKKKKTRKILVRKESIEEQKANPEKFPPRGLAGLLEGKIHYESDDIFNLGL